MTKQIGFVGLGRMGEAMTAHLVEEGYVVHGYDVSEDTRKRVEKNGVQTHDSYSSLVNALEAKKLIWLMVPSKVVDDVLAEVLPLLGENDVIVDGGNSFFKDSVRRYEEAAKSNIHYIDCGVSGGIEGARHGASLMVGGSEECFKEYKELFAALAVEDGYGYVGKSGAGHFVKMVHNSIEYGMMGAIAEGINVLKEHESEYDIRFDGVFRAYSNGSIISSSLISWLRKAYETPDYLEKIAGTVPHGETEDEMEFIEKNNEVTVLSAALAQRRATREVPSYIGTLIAAMRNQFGGHNVKKKDET